MTIISHDFVFLFLISYNNFYKFILLGKAIWKKMSGGPSTSVSPKTPEQKFDESKKKISEEVDLDDESSGGGEGSVEFKKLYPIASFDPKGNIKITQKGDDLGGGESEGGSMYIKSSMSDLKGSEPMWGADGELIERSNDDMTCKKYFIFYYLFSQQL